MRRIFFSMSLCILPSVAYADETGHPLKDLCSLYPQHSEKTAMCIGYIFGTLDVIRAYDRVKECEPTSWTYR